MVKENPRGNPSFLVQKVPVIGWLPKYNLQKLQADCVAGVTVGLMTVPQVLAYAKSIAGLPVQYGLWSAYIGVFVYFFFGTSKDITLGPTAIMSLITHNSAGQLANNDKLCVDILNSTKCADTTGCQYFHTNDHDWIKADGCHAVCYSQDVKLKECTDANAATILCLLGGVLNFLMGVFNFGFIVDFISYPVISGFTSAASITIATGQLHHLFGVKNSKRAWTVEVHDTIMNLPKAHVPDILMSVCCIALTVALEQLKKKMNKIPNRTPLQNVLWFIGTAGNFMTILAGTIAAYIWHQAAPDDICNAVLPGHNTTMYMSPDFGPLGAVKPTTVTSDCLTITGTIPPGIPAPEIPPGMDGSRVSSLASGAILVALIGYLESIAIAKAFARQNNYEVQPTQELIAIGLANIANFFFRAYPATGSFSRTAVNSASGVATPASGIVTGVIVLIAMQFITGIMKYIPSAALSSIIIVSVLKMFNWRIVLKMWKVSKLDLIPWACSFFLCVLVGIEYGVGIGMGINVVILLYKTARPAHEILVADSKTGTYRPKVTGGSQSIYEMPESQRVTIMRIGSSLFYSAGNHFKDAVREELSSSECKVLVLDFSAVASIDFSGVQALLETADDCLKQDVAVVCCQMKTPVYNTLDTAHFWDQSDDDGVQVMYFPMLPEAVSTAEDLVAEYEDGGTETLGSLQSHTSGSRGRPMSRKMSSLLDAKMSGMGGSSAVYNLTDPVAASPDSNAAIN